MVSKVVKIENMKLAEATIKDLGNILKSEYDSEFSKNDLEKVAYSLVGYFTLLLKAETRERNKAKFGNSSAVRIDSAIQKEEDENN